MVFLLKQIISIFTEEPDEIVSYKRASRLPYYRERKTSNFNKKILSFLFSVFWAKSSFGHYTGPHVLCYVDYLPGSRDD